MANTEKYAKIGKYGEIRKKWFIPAHFKSTSIDEESSAGKSFISGESTFEIFRCRGSTVEQVAAAILLKNAKLKKLRYR